MSTRDNFLAVLRHKTPDRVPYTPLIDEFNIPLPLPKRLLEPLNITDIVRYVGGDIMLRHVPIIKEHQCEVKVTRKEERDGTRTTYETPAGIISMKMKSDESKRTFFVTEFLVKNLADYEAFKYVIEDRTYELDESDFIQEVNYVGDDGLVTPGSPSTPIMDLIRYYMGVERFTYDLYDCPEKVEELMEIMGTKYLEWYQLLSKSSAEVVVCYDDADDHLISPKLFKKYDVPFLKKYSEMCHDAGKIFIYHACGHVNDFLKLLQETDIDAFDCLNIVPMGDVDNYREARRILGNKIVIIAGMNAENIRNKGVKEVTWRLSLPPKFEEKTRFLASIGFASKRPVKVHGIEVVPREVLAVVVEEQIKQKLKGIELKVNDMECVRAQVIGKKNGKKVEYILDCIVKTHSRWKVSCGDVCTGVPPSIVAQMQVGGMIKEPGVWAPEQVIDPEYFFKELAKREMQVQVTVKKDLM